MTLQQVRADYGSFTANQAFGEGHVLFDLAKALYRLAKTRDGAELMGLYVLAQVFEDLSREQPWAQVVPSDSEALYRLLDQPIRTAFAAIAGASRELAKT